MVYVNAIVSNLDHVDSNSNPTRFFHRWRHLCLARVTRVLLEFTLTRRANTLITVDAVTVVWFGQDKSSMAFFR